MVYTLKDLIVYEDDEILVINKPSGIHSTSLPQSTLSNPSCADLIAGERPHLCTIGEKSEDSSLMNRLDFMTSGILLAAKGEHVYRAVRAAFKNHTIEKCYVCALEGELKDDVDVKGTVGSRYRRSKKVSFFPTKDLITKRGSHVLTTFKPLFHDSSRDITVALASTSTGARHQIRVSAATLGTPLIGDKLYGSGRMLSDVTTYSAPPDFFLHALSYRLPKILRHVESVHADFPSWVFAETEPFFPREILPYPYFAV